MPKKPNQAVLDKSDNAVGFDEPSKCDHATHLDSEDISDEHIAQLAEIARVDLNHPDETLAALAADEMNRAEMSVLRAGAYLLQLKRQAVHGVWLPQVEALGLQRRAAQRAMQMARYVGALPPAEARRIAALPQRKILALTKADPEVVNELLETGQLDGSQPLSVRGLLQRLKESETENAKLRGESAKAKDIQTRLARAGSALEVEGELPAFARAPRHETFAFEEMADFMLDNLTLVYGENLYAQVAHPEVHRFQPVVATNCDAALGKVQARIAAMRASIRERFPNTDFVALTHEHQLSPREAGLLAERCDRMKYQLKEQVKKRAEDRANSQVGRRGRTLGS